MNKRQIFEFFYRNNDELEISYTSPKGSPSIDNDQDLKRLLHDGVFIIGYKEMITHYCENMFPGDKGIEIPLKGKKDLIV